ncbi:MAG: thioredoxin domain-containing protein [Alphaproteobacteria bacterium]
MTQTPAGHQNQLANENSPYLLQHKDNPVHWRPWGKPALGEARALGRPILLSVGYSACHWCHVMAHESFENAAIAAVMNDLFVNVKVDREERPDIDAIYQSALALMGEQGGWPLTMFLTPDGEPFWGGTYFPPERRYGRPGFPELLKRVATTFRGQQDAVRQNVAALRGALGRLSTPPPADDELPTNILVQVAEKLVEHVDFENGGFGGAPKFPQVSVFDLFWRAYRRDAAPRLGEAVTTSLDRMCQGGIYDHVGGGFARYSVDEVWLVPHFEKMLYDNAQLVELMTLAWQHTKSRLYRERITETIDWIMREMRDPEGGFFSSLDADSEGEEGKFYVWTEGEIDALLGPHAALFKTIYDVSARGNWEHANILNRSKSRGFADDDIESRLADCRMALLEHRRHRVRPGLDDKCLADWNGLMIAALALAGDVFEKPEWTAAAARAFDFVQLRMTENGRLRHSWRRGTLRHPATLDDYANMSRAALALHEALGDEHYLLQAEQWVEIANRHYWDAHGGGYFFSADDTDDLIARTKSAQDQAVPSGNGTIAGVLARLFLLTGNRTHRERAESLIRTFSGELGRNIFGLGGILAAHGLLGEGRQIALIGERTDPRLTALRRAVNDVSMPERVSWIVPPGAKFPIGHPLLGKIAVDGKPTAYICRGPSCSLPITDPVALRAALGA